MNDEKQPPQFLINKEESAEAGESPQAGEITKPVEELPAKKGFFGWLKKLFKKS